METKDVIEAIEKGAGILFSFYIQYGVYIVARDLSARTKRSRLNVYLRALAASVILGLVAWTFSGTHTEDGDPLFGGGTTEVDFTPTDTQRNQWGITAFTIASALTLTGAFIGLRDRTDESQKVVGPSDRLEGGEVSSGKS